MVDTATKLALHFASSFAFDEFSVSRIPNCLALALAGDSDVLATSV